MGEEEKNSVSTACQEGGHRSDFSLGLCCSTDSDKKEVAKSCTVALAKQINPNNLLHSPRHESTAKKVEMRSVPCSQGSQRSS